MKRRLIALLSATGLFLVGAFAVTAQPAAAISNNNSIVTNSVTALPATTCSGHLKVDNCVKLQGSLDVVAGEGVPSLYSIDELAFIRDSGTISGITPRFFTSTGQPSLGSGAINSTSLACYVLDANPGVAGTLNYSCEMSSLACNALYRYHFAASHTTSGAVEHSNINTTATSRAAYTTPCTPSAPAATTLQRTSATLGASVAQGALAQTIRLEWGTSTSYGGAAVADVTVAAANSSSSPVAFDLSGLTCGTTYHARLTSTTSDAASVNLNGSVTVNGPDLTFTTASCATAPGAPTITSVTAGDTHVSVAFDPPASDGGAAISSFTASCGGRSATGPSSPITVTGLTNGTAVTCTVVATNSVGDSAASAPSASVTPKGTSSVAVTATPNPATVRQPVTYTATVTPSSATGTVAFRDNGTPIAACAAVTVVGGTAQCTVSYSAAGSHIPSVVYSGSASVTGSTVTGSTVLVSTGTCANLAGCNLQGAVLTGAALTGADLTGANLRAANLTDANLSGANLSAANLQSAKLVRAKLTSANLTNANLTSADLSGADLTGARLAGATLTKVRWSNTVCPDGTNSDANGRTCAGHLG